METNLKKILRSICIEIRHSLEGYYDSNGNWVPGDLENRLASLGIWPDRDFIAVSKLPSLPEQDIKARRIVEAYVAFRKEAATSQKEAVREFIRESAYTWANRLLILRCMESRSLIDEVILQKEAYGWRSLKHNRLAQKSPETVSSEDEGLFHLLNEEVQIQSRIMPSLFDPDSPAAQLRPSIGALKYCISLLSGRETVRGQEPAADAVFSAPDALGWAYQYWNSEAKDRVFENIRTKKGAKIEGADIIPATQLYTEPYMVKFLVQNSLGAIWMQMHPKSELSNSWEYYVNDAYRAGVENKSVADITFIDPAVGSGHFLLEAFDLFYEMYRKEGVLEKSEHICAAILNRNLYGIDIDERAVQLSAAVLWMRAKEKAPNLDFTDVTNYPTHLISTNICLPKGENHLEVFLKHHPEDKALKPALKAVFDALESVHELGSLVKLEEPVEEELRRLQLLYEKAIKEKKVAELFSEFEKPLQGELPVGIQNYEDWKTRTLLRLRRHFENEAQNADLSQAFFSRSVNKALSLFDLLSRKYDVVAANPPYLGTKRMSPALKSLFISNYGAGKRDAYAAFIERSLELAPNGYIAMVTPQTWVFLSSFSDLRLKILSKENFELLAHFGRYAFDDGDIRPVLFIISYGRSKENCTTKAFRLNYLGSNIDHGLTLREAIKGKIEKVTFVSTQKDFLLVPNNAIAYWVGKDVIRVFDKNNRADSKATICQGMASSDNSRFVRLLHEFLVINKERECARNEAWVLYAKSGEHRRWAGQQKFVINWGYDGTRVREYAKNIYGSETRTIKNQKYYFHSGYTYSYICNGSLNTRVLENAVFDVASVAIFEVEENYPIFAVFNSRFASWLLRVITQNIMFQAGAGASLPIPQFGTNEMGILNWVEKIAFQKKKELISFDLLEYEFKRENFIARGLSLFDFTKYIFQKANEIASRILFIEGINEKVCANSYGFSSDTLRTILEEVGEPTGWLAFSPKGEVGKIIEVCVEEEILKRLQLLGFANPKIDHELNLAELKNKLRHLLSNGPGGIESMSDEEGSVTDEDDEKEDALGARIPVPDETFIEELSHKANVSPLSIYSLLKEGMEKEGWRCLPEERRIIADYFTVMILCLLGHRWPKQIEAGEPIPQWADEDGIIPLTPDCGEKTLIQRVRERIAKEFEGSDVNAIEREFQVLMGKSLEEWLETEFFKRHISQFKKRPIAWHLQSTPTNGTGRGRSPRKPAFSCFLYYHAFGHERGGKRQSDQVVANVRSQYVGPLRSRYATELNNLEKTTTPSGEQQARKETLELKIRELEEFDQKLEELSNKGFDFDGLKAMLQNENIDAWTQRDESETVPVSLEAFYHQERRYDPDINDGVRVNIASLQKLGLLACDVLAKKDIEEAIQDRAEWRADDRRWCREGKLPRPGWWKQKAEAEVSK